MTSNKMENPLLKMLQSDPSFLKFQQQQQQQQQLQQQMLNMNPASAPALSAGNGNNILLNQQISNINPSNFMLNNNNQQFFQQQSNDLNLNTLSSFSNSNLGMLLNDKNTLNGILNNQQPQQQISPSSSSSNNPNSPFDQTALNNLSQILMKNENEMVDNNNYLYGDKLQQQQSQQREVGVIQTILNTYGLIKAQNKDQPRLFFTNNNTTGLIAGDLVEFDETYDKRNNKFIALNIRKISNNKNQPQQQQYSSQQIDSSLNLMNLKELLLKNGNNGNNNTNSISPNESATGSSNGRNTPNYNQQQQSYNYLMNGLKMLNIQENENSNINNQNDLNSVINLLNSNNGLNQFQPTQSANLNGNSILNLLKNANNLIATTQRHSNGGSESMEGIIAIAAMKRQINNTSLASLEGRITYQRNGETYYIPYLLNDVALNPLNGQQPQLKIGDRVRFSIAQVQNQQQQQIIYATTSLNIPIGTVYARRVELIQSPSSSLLSLYNSAVDNTNRKLYRGIISSLKDTFGKIEREDLFKETFFHFNDYKGKNAHQELRLGLNVEFEIQDRYGKEIACNIRMLPEGTVTFDEISSTIYVGRIIQPPMLTSSSSSNSSSTPPISIGSLIFDYNDDSNLIELKFTERDRIPECGKYTLLEGDFVQFRIATDKRRMINSSTNQRRATQISLIEEHSLNANSQNTKEHRERGVLIKLLSANDLLNLQNGNTTNNSNSNNEFLNKINYGAIKCIEQDEIIYFSFNEIINYAKFTSNKENDNSPTSTSHQITYKINQVKLELGDSLEFSVVECSSKSNNNEHTLFKNGLKAIRVCQLARNTVRFHLISDDFVTGYVEKEPLMLLSNSAIIADSVASNRYQDDFDNYSGSIVYYEDNNTKKSVYFNPLYQQKVNETLNLTNNGDKDSENNTKQPISNVYLGDKIQFNLCTCVRTQQKFAVNIKLVESRKERGFVTMLKDNYGFIEINLFQEKKISSGKTPISRDIFFHFSSLQFSINDLDVGDEVEFTINRKNKQKLCAENVCKLQNGIIKPLTANILSTITYKGKVIQSLRSQNPNANNQNSSNYSNNPSQEQTDDLYYGKIQLINENSTSTKNEPTYQFGLFSLNDKRLYLQQGDVISFQLIDLIDMNNKKFAYNIQLIQQSSAGSQSDMISASSSSRLRGAGGEYKKGKIDSIKGHSGHIEYSVGNSGDYKKVYFHISDVILDSNNNNNTQNQNGEQLTTTNGSSASSSSGNSSSLKPGDDVEFLVSHNPRNGKYTATRIRRTSTSISSNQSQTKTSNSSSNQLSSINNSNNGSSSNLISSDNTTTEKRPERLITKLKTANIDNISGKMLILIRQPNNPDTKIKSFSRQLKERLPGSLTPLADQTGVNNNSNQQQSASSIVDLLVDSNN